MLPKSNLIGYLLLGEYSIFYNRFTNFNQAEQMKQNLYHFTDLKNLELLWIYAFGFGCAAATFAHS